MSHQSLLSAASAGHARQRIIVDHERQQNDFYIDPPFCTELLLGAVGFCGPVWDPCCGRGTIPEVFDRLGTRDNGIRASDLVDRGYPGTEIIDFFASRDSAENIVFNPPYAQAEAFIRHALDLASGVVAALVNLKFLASQGRRQRLFVPYPPVQILVLSRRPSMPPGGSGLAAKGGTADYCWLLHQRGHVGPTMMRWLA